MEKHERTLAAAMHFCAIPWPLIAPAVGFLVGQPGSFLRAHSVFRLKRELLQTALVLIVGAIYFLASLPSWIHQFQTGFKDLDWAAFLLRSVAVWLLSALYGLWNSAECIIWGIRCLKGADVPGKRKSLPQGTQT